MSEQPNLPTNHPIVVWRIRKIYMTRTVSSLYPGSLEKSRGGYRFLSFSILQQGSLVDSMQKCAT